MRIGILTQPLHLNYGGILQNWALQQVLKQMGHEPVLIGRCNDEPQRTPILIARRCLVFIKKIFEKHLGINPYLVYRSPFARVYDPLKPRYSDSKFVRSLSQTRKCYSDRKFRTLINKEKFDAFIVGSDQVWRQEYSPRIESYFLDFLSPEDKRKRIAYAASFGVDSGYIDKDKIALCRELLKRFDAVSVREDSGLRIVQEEFDRKDAVKVLDPTLLLVSEDYKKLIAPKDRSKCTTPYVASYILDNNADKSAIINSVVDYFNLPVHSMSANYEGKKMPTISQWLSNFANADFVITDSFHGCVFSIIFRKPFIAIGNAWRGMDRLTSLLSVLNLSNRLVNNYDEFISKRQMLLAPIDYSEVIPLLEKQRQFSSVFLKNTLKNN